MIEAKIRSDITSTVDAAGTVPELLEDVALLINVIYNQFSNVDPGAAEMFRIGLRGFINDKNSAVWKPTEGMTGIIFPKPE